MRAISLIRIACVVGSGLWSACADTTAAASSDAASGGDVASADAVVPGDDVPGSSEDATEPPTDVSVPGDAAEPPPEDVVEDTDEPVEEDVPVVPDVPEPPVDVGPPADLGGVDAGPAPDVVEVPDVPCVPDCEDKECDDDGCGGSCGTCPSEAPTCFDGVCVGECTPTCAPDQVCGDDGCGGLCGKCDPGNYCAGTTCSPGTECAGIAACSGQCGSDDACVDACFDPASLDSLLLLTEVQLCQLENCFGAADVLTCTGTVCLQSYVACFVGQAGSESCKAISDCTAECEGAGCLNQCMGKGTMDAISAFLQYLGCVSVQCPAGSPIECTIGALAGACKPLFEACIPPT